MHKYAPLIALSLVTTGCNVDITDMIFIDVIPDIVEVDTYDPEAYETHPIDVLVALSAGDTTSFTELSFDCQDYWIDYDFHFPEGTAPATNMETLVGPADFYLLDGTYDSISIYASTKQQTDWVIENFGIYGLLEGGTATLTLQGEDQDGDVVHASADFAITFGNQI